jgi:5,10-methylenetetrahydrofolate reductase
LTLKEALRDRPVLYEVVPPRREPSKFETELKGLDGVLADRRVSAINIPELFERLEQGGRVTYAPATIPPEEYAKIIGKHKETVVNVVAPRLTKQELLSRIRRMSESFGVRNTVVVGKERREDALPGPNVTEAIELIRGASSGIETIGGICIFERNSKLDSDYSPSEKVDEYQRALAKTQKCCDFLTSQITYDSEPASNFITSYQAACEKAEVQPATVFVRLSTIQSEGIMELMDKLDVRIPLVKRKRILQGNNPGRASVEVAAEVFGEVIDCLEKSGAKIPIGLQVEQVGVNSADLTLELLDRAYPVLKDSQESMRETQYLKILCVSSSHHGRNSRIFLRPTRHARVPREYRHFYLKDYRGHDKP